MVRVIDASVALKWFVDEPGTNQALTILQEVIDTPSSFAVPELFYFELVHVFHRLVPRPSDVQRTLLEQVCLFGLERFSMTPELLRETHLLQRVGLSGYDAAYAGLAKLLKGKWVTFDSKAHRLLASQHLSLLLT